MDLGIAGRVALVLGGGGGLGSAIALALGAEGARIAVADVSPAAIESTSERLEAIGASALGLQWNLADPSVIWSNLGRIEAGLGPVDILVNITGGPPPGSAQAVDRAQWTAQFESMVLPVFAITAAVLPGMRQRKWGRVITSTSSGVIAPIPNLAVSNALRSSLLGWSKSLAREVARDGVTCNIVVPGRIMTQRIMQLDKAKAEREGSTVEQVAAASTESIPVGRYGRPEEYADAVAFLASDRATYITGSIFRVDGGLIASI
jgi:3-oxoacyl-[acyl-carrier protein] reductase